MGEFKPENQHATAFDLAEVVRQILPAPAVDRAFSGKHRLTFEVWDSNSYVRPLI